MTVGASVRQDEGELRATIRRTSHGIPHIIAGDWADLAFGYGHALAQDDICSIADAYVTARAERSRYFGPNGSYVFQGNGFRFNNLNSDFFFQRIIDDGVVEELVNQPPPQGPAEEIREGVRGYVEGYNMYLRETGVENIPDPACRGAPWVREITEMDAYRRFYQLASLASAGVAIDGIGSAQPPPGLRAPGGAQTSPDPEGTARELEGAGLGRPLGAAGSNAYGLGAEVTDNGSGMVLANPHFPWQGSERFHQAHLTIPGRLNVSGASLFGVPLILIGHTENMAWSHTVSTAFRFTPFEEKLVPGAPTKYIYDGGVRDMEADAVSVIAADPGQDPAGCSPSGPGTLHCTRTLYSTHHGPIFTSLAGVPLPWTETTAFAMGDANAANFRYLNHFFETNQAQSVRELDEILRRNQGIPWVNTIAADSSGEAYYADLSVVPHVTDEQAQACNTPLGAATFQALRLPVLDGSRSDCEWGSDPDAAQQGIFGPSNLPSLFRNDYVTNSNDSYWLSNPEQPLEGFDRIIGDERTQRSLRTRSGLIMVEERLTGTDGRPGNAFTLSQLQDMVFDNRQYAGELFRDELVAMCEQQPVLLASDASPVDVSAACPVLASWDLHDDLDSNGAILFREFARNALASAGGVVPPQGVFDQPFNASDPVHTPRGLNTENPNVRRAFADAVDELRTKGIPLDAPLGGYQFELRGDEAIPIHGGPGVVGVFNAINVGDLVPNQGYPDVPHGSSFVMVTGFRRAGCLEDRSVLTYSQSESSESPLYADQTRMFSAKQWVDVPFYEEEIAADPELRVTNLNGGYSPPSSSASACAPRCATETRGTKKGDSLRGTEAGDRIKGRGGNDRIRGLGGDDCLKGNRGRDRVKGGADNDQVTGGRGRDRLRGGAGRDRLKARGGGRDVVRCGKGRDKAVVDRRDKVRGCEKVRGARRS
jgi:acyl-homoserine-lactone acylase